ncbi:MAG: DUF1585 domain-containing protein, partial [Verrucomicrobiota bacterium]
DPSLDGPVENALEMIDRLAESERVQQVFVRHAFRYWMGRNETIDDVATRSAMLSSSNAARQEKLKRASAVTAVTRRKVPGGKIV